MKAMRLKPSSYFLIALMAIAVFLGVVSMTYASPKDWVVPLCACGVIVILGAIQLREEIMAPPEAAVEAKPADDDDDDDDDLSAVTSEETAPEKELPAFLWVLGLMVGILLFGFLVSLPVFTLAYMKWGARRGWLVAFVSAVLMETCFYLVFVVAVRTHLYPGLLFGGML